MIVDCKSVGSNQAAGDEEFDDGERDEELKANTVCPLSLLRSIPNSWRRWEDQTWYFEGNNF